METNADPEMLANLELMLNMDLLEVPEADWDLLEALSPNKSREDAE